MRWLLLSDRAAAEPLGGMTVVLTRTAAAFIKAGDEVHWVTGRLNDSLPLDGDFEGIHVHGVEMPDSGGPLALLSAFRRIRDRTAAVIRAHGFDAAVVHQPLAGAATGTLLQRAGIPACYFFHSPWSEEYAADRGTPYGIGTGVRRFLERRALGRVDRVCVFGETMAEALHRVHPSAPPPVRVTPGVDADRFQPLTDRAAARKRLGWLPAERHVFCLRRLVRRTGVDLLLGAFARIAADHPGVILVIGGTGPLADELIRLASGLGIGERVQFTGYIPDDALPDALGGADLVVVPTRALEGLGLVTLEALACGTPVVATPVGGNVEILRGIEPTWLSRDISTEALAETLHRVLASSPEELHARGGRAREQVLERYGWSRTAADLRAAVTGP